MADTQTSPLGADALTVLADRVRRSPHNLMSRRGLEEVEERHIPECVRLAALLPEHPIRLLDVGSGGGFPGLVLAAVRPDLDITLLEATTKKAVFLRETAAEMAVAVRVVNARAEEVSSDPALAGRFDVVTARAVAPLARLVPWVAPFLAPGGRLLAVKGERWRQELEEALGAIRAAGLEVVSTPEGDVAEGGEPMVVIIGRPHRSTPASGETGDSAR